MKPGDEVWYYPKYPIKTEGGTTDRKKMQIVKVREDDRLDLSDLQDAKHPVTGLPKGELNLKLNIPRRSPERELRVWEPLEEA